MATSLLTAEDFSVCFRSSRKQITQILYWRPISVLNHLCQQLIGFFEYDLLPLHNVKEHCRDSYSVSFILRRSCISRLSNFALVHRRSWNCRTQFMSN
jgi:hypothetical protein